MMVERIEPNKPRPIDTVIYALSIRTGPVPDGVLDAIRQLSAHSRRVVVLHGAGLSVEDVNALTRVGCACMAMPEQSFVPVWYWTALGSLELARDGVDIVLTGDAAIGPISDLGPILERQAATAVQAWQMVENNAGFRESFFPIEGFEIARPWMWTQLAIEVVRSEGWRSFRNVLESEPVVAQWRLLDHLSATGARTGYAFDASDFPDADPALVHPELLVERGCPFVDMAVFREFPPHLNRRGVIGRDVADAICAAGYPRELLWSTLSRSIPPRVLNANASMLEVIDSDRTSVRSLRRLVVVVRVSDLTGIDALLTYLGNLPDPFDLVVTVKDGVTAGRVERRIESWWSGREGRFDIRVTPASAGGDMAHFLVGCRDVLRPGAYDLVLKLSVRRMRHRTVNVARYFRRYQFDNLLESPEHAAGILEMFEREQGLGLVFPPMVHIGYPTMGNGWSGHAGQAMQLAVRLGIDVPLDEGSPLAPYGGMFVARPAALRLLTDHGWSYTDYTRDDASSHDLGATQERLLTAAAAHLGFHTRTVLSRSHAAIVHTSAEYKADEMFSTTRGYPSEQIKLLRRAGTTGHGGLVSLIRMYVNMNHPRLARIAQPLSSVASRVLRLARRARRAALSARRGTRKGKE